MVGHPEYILSKKCFQCELTTRENTKLSMRWKPFTKASKLSITYMSFIKYKNYEHFDSSISNLRKDLYK